MTDEQISEFAEALADACEMAPYEPIRLPADGLLTELEIYGSTWPRRVSAKQTFCRCPLGALWPQLAQQRPNAGTLAAFVRNAPHPTPPLEFLAGFIDGFEELADAPVLVGGDPRGFALGRHFRELYP